jgi:hypothetical protein
MLLRYRSLTVDSEEEALSILTGAGKSRFSSFEKFARCNSGIKLRACSRRAGGTRVAPLSYLTGFFIAGEIQDGRANITTERGIMHSQSNNNHLRAGRGIYPNPALQAKMYRTFLQMRELLEYHSPLWYPEDLHDRADAVLRECGTRAESRHRNEKPLRRRKLARRSDFLPSKPSRHLTSQARL